jgi:hypothetical protein
VKLGYYNTNANATLIVSSARESDYFDSSIFTFSGLANNLGSKSISPYPLTNHQCLRVHNGSPSRAFDMPIL